MIPDGHKHLKNFKTPEVYEHVFRKLLELGNHGVLMENYNISWIIGLKQDPVKFDHQLRQIKRREVRNKCKLLQR